MFCMMDAKDTLFSKKRSLNLRGRIISINMPMVMGIINVTPDSFYSRSRFMTEHQVLKHCEKIYSDGADIIDLGAYSSRPGADDISLEEEKRRLGPILESIRLRFPEAIISVDTFRSEVASMAVNDFEVDIINDIAGGDLDNKMFNTIATLKVPYILMHIKGTPQTMQQYSFYKNISNEIMQYFAEKVNILRQMGVADLILDPGFGFAKTIADNYNLLANLSKLQLFNLPILVGISRKSMIYKLLETKAEEALNGTTVINSLALLNGADIIRVHDVKEAVECVKLISEYKRHLPLNN